MQKRYFPITGVLLLILLAILLLWFNNSTSLQAEPALIAQVYFDGEYRINDGAWQKIVAGEHIPSTKGDVTLRGNFHMPDHPKAGDLVHNFAKHLCGNFGELDNPKGDLNIFLVILSFFRPFRYGKNDLSRSRGILSPGAPIVSMVAYVVVKIRSQIDGFSLIGSG